MSNLKWLLLLPVVGVAIVLGIMIPQWISDEEGSSQDGSNGQQAVQLELGEYESRIAAYEELLERDPNDTVAIKGLGDVYLELGVLQSQTGDVNEAYRNYKSASDQYQQYLDAKPDDVDVKIELGLTYSYLLLYDLAERELSEVTAMQPDNQRAWHSLGWILYQANRASEATTAWQKSVEIDPNSPIGQESQRFIEETQLPGTVVPDSP